MGLIVARISGGIDIREHGSGNIGLTNVVRTLGWGPGSITGVLDFLKGYLPVTLAMYHFNAEQFGGVSLIYEAVIIMIAASLVIGNLYPVYLLFKGGKGIATGLGVMSALMGVFIFIPLAIFGIILFLLRYVSLASITAALAVPLTIMVLSGNIQFIHIANGSTSARMVLLIFTWLAVTLIIWRHKSNISRIFKGTEPKISKPKEPQVKIVSDHPPQTGPTTSDEEIIVIEEEEDE